MAALGLRSGDVHPGAHESEGRGLVVQGIVPAPAHGRAGGPGAVRLDRDHRLGGGFDELQAGREGWLFVAGLEGILFGEDLPAAGRDGPVVRVDFVDGHGEDDVDQGLVVAGATLVGPRLGEGEDLLPGVEGVRQAVLVAVGGVELQGLQHGLVPGENHAVVGYGNELDGGGVRGLEEYRLGDLLGDLHQVGVQVRDGLGVPGYLSVDDQDHVGHLVLEGGYLVGGSLGAQVHVFEDAGVGGIGLVPGIDDGIAPLVRVYGDADPRPCFDDVFSADELRLRKSASRKDAERDQDNQ